MKTSRDLLMCHAWCPVALDAAWDVSDVCGGTHGADVTGLRSEVPFSVVLTSNVNAVLSTTAVLL